MSAPARIGRLALATCAWLSALCACLWWCASARADDVSELQALLGDQIVQTGSSSANSASVAPATVVTITAEDLRTFGLRSLDEAINFAAAGMITEYNMHDVEVGARGVLINADYGNHVLLMVNGLALNEPWDGTAYFDRGAGIPMEMIDRIELMLGPGSVVYGSQAMLATINIITKDGATNKGLHMIAEGEAISPLANGGKVRSPASDRYAQDLGGAYRAGLGYGRKFELFKTEGDVSLHAEYYQLHGAATSYKLQNWGDDAITGKPKKYGPGEGTGLWGGKATHSWYTQVPVGYGRVRLGDFTLSARGGMNKRSVPYEDALVRYFGDFDPKHDFERDRWGDLELAYSRQVSERLRVSGRAFMNYNRYELYDSSSAEEDCEDGQISGCRHDTHGIGRRFGLELKGAMNWRDRFYQTTLIGGFGQLRDVNSRVIVRSADGNSKPFGVIDLVDYAGAVFAEHTIRPARWMDVNLGARLDADQRAKRPRLSPRAALAFSLWSGATLKGIYSEAFRAPSAYELYYEDGYSQVKSRHLGPETMRGVEIAFEQRIGPHRLFLDAFRSWWHDMIFFDTLSDAEAKAEVAAGHVDPDAMEVSQYRNEGRIDNIGGTAGYRVATFGRRLFFETNLTAAHTRVAGKNMPSGPPTVTPQWFGNARISYDLPEAWPVLALAAGFRGNRRTDRYYDGGFTKPPVAPATLELKATLTGELPALPELKYRLSVDYVSAGGAAYTTGALQFANDASSVPQLQPINRLYAFFGLQYDLPY